MSMRCAFVGWIALGVVTLTAGSARAQQPQQNYPGFSCSPVRPEPPLPPDPCPPGLNQDITVFGFFFVGTDGPDCILATNDVNVIFGGGGDDFICAYGGSDLIFGAAGSDDAYGGLGEDTLLGGSGNDYLDGGPGNDELDGGGPFPGESNSLFGGLGFDICNNADTSVSDCDVFTHVTLQSFDAFVEDGAVVLRWETASEAGTLGFRLLRERGGQWEAAHDGLLPGLLSSPQGGVYDFRDDTATPGEPERYLLIEVEVSGRESSHGPFEVVADSAGTSVLRGDARYDHEPHARTASSRASLRSTIKSGDVPKQLEGEPVALYLGVEQTGLYKVSATEIAARLGIDEDEVRNRIVGGGVSLTEQGQLVAWTGSPDGGELWFYGLLQKSLYTTERLYRLTLEPGVTMGERSVAPGAITEGLSYDAQLHLEQDEVPAPFVGKDPEGDYWFWQPVTAAPMMPFQAEVAFELEAVAGGGEILIDLHGGSSTAHAVEVEINDTVVGTVEFEGVVPHRATLPVPQSALQEGPNTLSIRSSIPSESLVYLNLADLTYTRSYATAASFLSFGAREDASVEIEGPAGDDVALFDVTEPRRPVRLNDALRTGDGLQLEVTAGREYFAVPASEARRPESIWVDVASELRSERNGASYLVIAPAQLADGAQALADYREADGLTAQVVDLQDVYDEFSQGMPDPNAIRAFLGYTHQHWDPAPELVLLVGKGSLDYRDLQGMGGNLLPPIMALSYGAILSSDTRFADFLNDDGVPDVSIGRLPVMTASELAQVIEQIKNYESSIGSWNQDIAMLADATDAGADFGASADRATAALPEDWQLAPIYRSELGDLQSTRALLFDEIRRGPRVLGYIGHAGITSLGKSEVLLSIDDLETMEVDGTQPIFAGMTCYSSRFALPGVESLGEAMLLSEESAIAVWGASGLSSNEAATRLLEELLAELSVGSHARLGPMIDQALGALAGLDGGRDMMQMYHLFGDPALRVATTAGQAPPGGDDVDDGGSAEPGGATEDGGGGCAVRRTSPEDAGALLLLLVLALVTVRRRLLPDSR